MRTNHILLIGCIFALLPSVAIGQDAFDTYKKKKTQKYNEYIEKKGRELGSYKERKRKEFDEYRKKKNEEFAKYLGITWVEYPKEAPIPAPIIPEPSKPVVVPKNEIDPLPTKPIEVPRGEVVPIIVPKHEPSKEIPKPQLSPSLKVEKMSVYFYGLNLKISMNNSLRFSLNSLAEKDIALVWNKLSEDAYTPMFDDCASLVEELQLNGWGTMKLCQAIGEVLEGSGTNGAVLLQTYLLTQLGFDARMVRVNNNQLRMMCPASEKLCETSYLVINGKEYYIFGNIANKSTIHTYKNNFDAATRSLDLGNPSSIRFAFSPSNSKTFTSKWNKGASVTVGINKNLVDFYNGMPFVKDWSYYARQRMDKELAQQLLPALKRSINGKDELGAVNILLHFVQTAFEYMTDEKQFGHEKTDFKEQLFYDKACDCEDRSILFSDLVYNLLNLDVVLLYYPNHLCTAVKFNSIVNGDYVMVGNDKYIICDPTYINASVGNCMPKFKTKAPKIFKVYK